MQRSDVSPVKSAPQGGARLGIAALYCIAFMKGLTYTNLLPKASQRLFTNPGEIKQGVSVNERITYISVNIKIFTSQFFNATDLLF